MHTHSSDCLSLPSEGRATGMAVILLVFGVRQAASPRAERRGEDLTSIDVLLVIEIRIVPEVRSFPICYRERKESRSRINLHHPADAQVSTSS